MDRELVLRRARGYAPLPVTLSIDTADSVLAYGAHQKCAAALSVGPQVFVSQHIGDMETAASLRAHKRLTVDLPRIYDKQPTVGACDMHPDYATTGLARSSGLRVIPVQHHYAHVLSCMADNELTGPVLGVVWDGTGYGTDGTIWGGEFLAVDDAGFRRVGHLRPFLLPGGERAVRQPRRTALALLYDLYGADAFAQRDLLPVTSFSVTELGVLSSMIEKRLNSPTTTSAGRLFDAAASLIGLCQRAGFEGQAAMLLEYRALECQTDASYEAPVREDESGALVVDWRVTVEQMLADLRKGAPVSQMAAMFHNALVDAIVEVAARVNVRTSIDRVALSGGCFQNKYLTERTVQRLQAAGLKPYWHQRIPPNDGGIAVGQVVAALHARAASVQKAGSSSTTDRKVETCA